MTDTDLTTTGTEPASGSAANKRTEARRGGGLSTMLLPELRSLAGQLGIKGTSGMRKSDLLAAVRENQSQQAPNKAKVTAPKAVEPKTGEPKTVEPRADVARSAESTAPDKQGAPAGDQASATQASVSKAPESKAPAAQDSAAKASTAKDETREPVKGTQQSGSAAGDDVNVGESDTNRSAQSGSGDSEGRRNRRQRSGERQSGERQSGERQSGERQSGDSRQTNRNQGGSQGKSQADSSDSDGSSRQQSGGQGGRDNQRSRSRDGRDSDGSDGSRRGRRFRERPRRGGRDQGDGNVDMEVREDDVVQPVAGILDVLDNYAFVRTSGYLAGPNDVYVSMNMIRKNGLRRGDAITGAVRVARQSEQGSQRQKFNPLVRLDTVNGGPVEDAKHRPDFSKLTPLYPNERLRLETESNILTTRIIDLIMPIGKGQRALIVSPPKAGKTTILQNIANAIAINNPECYLMVVLVDERPEEVTDMQRSVRGEVIASTFDRPPSDHTSVAELAIARAKRLVEMDKDVVVLLDSITRLGRAYNNSSPASGRILSGGVDSTALYPPKRFLGAARNIENGGSLTIIATAMVETGSQGDTVIFEEFKGTGNAELKLDRKIAERRVFPAVDINPSGTRRDDLLLAPEEAAVMHKLRRVMSGLDSHQAIDVLMDQMKKTRNNYEFLMQVSKTALGGSSD